MNPIYRFSLNKLTTTTNLLNPDYVEQGVYANWELGGLGTNANYAASGFCNVSPSGSYKGLTAGNVSYLFRSVVFYDYNKIFISGIENASIFKVPSNCYYVQLTLAANLDYANFGLFALNQTYPQTNVFNPITITKGYYINWNSGALAANPAYLASDFCNISPSSSYNIMALDSSLYGSRGIAFYDSGKNFISGMQNIKTFTTPSNCYFVRITLNTGLNPEDYGVFLSSVIIFTPYYHAVFLLYYNYITRYVSPVYKDDLAKEYELETNQRFYRAKLSGKIAFIRDDYDYIRAQSFNTEFVLIIEKSDDFGKTYAEYYRGKFMNTDCEFSDDDRKCTLQPDTLDNYNDVLAGLEKEYNLITLAPEITRLKLDKRPLIQIYIPGDSVVSCFLTGLYWEQDANAITDRNALVNTYHFALCNLLKEIKITVNGTPTDANGLYAGRMTVTGSNVFTGTLYPDINNGYIIRASQQYAPPFWGVILYELVRQSDNVVLFRYQIAVPGNQPWDNVDFDMTAVTDSGATGTAHAEMATYSIYARYLLDVDTISGLNTYPIPIDDIVENNRNYRRAIGYAIDVAYISNNYSDVPTEWGLSDNGKYFAPPYTLWGQTFFPIARSTWRYASIWFGFSSFDWILEKEGRKQYTLRDSYPLSSVLQVLLSQFAPQIRHDGTPEYSQFLYGASNPISGIQFTTLVTQKTNLLVGDYDNPAQKAPTTLQQFTNMLRDCYKCYWYLDGNKFKIEHINWFKNGGTYSYNQQLTADLTQLTNIRNGKKWGFKSSAWSFDKVDMAERFQFKWMDDVTKGFEGYPIDILSKYVTAGKIEDVNVSNFTSDVDYMILNPAAIANDGFALFGAIKDDTGAYVLPYITLGISGLDYILQNGYLSWMFLQSRYWVYDLPAYDAMINNELAYVQGIERKKKQVVEYPSNTDPDPMKLIKTYLGNGQIDKISVNLHSRMNKVTLKYDTN